jgi:hypothetical protein
MNLILLNHIRSIIFIRVSKKSEKPIKPRKLEKKITEPNPNRKNPSQTGKKPSQTRKNRAKPV